MSLERPGAVTLGGRPLTLVGPGLERGAHAPGFTVLSPEFRPISLDWSPGRTRILLSVGSLDTPVCDLEAKEFSRRVIDLPNVEVLVVSMDLPFALNRWCGSEGVTNLAVGSDHRDLSFGLAYGVAIKESRLLSRAAFVVSPADQITHVEYVPEIDAQPDYDAVIRAARG